MRFTVGQKVFVAESYYRRGSKGYTTTVAGIGRKYIKLQDSSIRPYYADKDTLVVYADAAKQHAYGHLYESEEAYRLEQEKFTLWTKLKNSMGYTAPKHVTKDDLLKIIHMLKFEECINAD